jgi:hypothetical protein
MSLKDLDRPAVKFRHDPWDRELVFRPITALSAVQILGAFQGVDRQPADTLTPETLRFYAELLAATCEDPVYSAAEWLEASPGTLLELGMRALRVNGMAEEEAKKNSTTSSTDSPSSSAES